MRPNKPKPRRWYVWLDKQIPGGHPTYTRVEMPAGSTDRECREECGDALDTLIGNELDTGWNELEEGEDWPEGCDDG